jgi:Leucine-rich repeat (LRR) protein
MHRLTYDLKMAGLFLFLWFFSAPLMAQSTGSNPILTLETAVKQYFWFDLSATKETKLTVDFGDSTAQVTLFPDSITYIPGTVGASGVVKVYGDPTDITYFRTNGCFIDKIDLTALTALNQISLSHNTLKALDVSNCKDLEYLALDDNQLSTSDLNFGSIASLVYLDVSENENINSINLQQFPLLQVFKAWACRNMYSVDTSANPELTDLTMDFTGIYSVDVSKNPKLKILDVSQDYVNQVDVSKNPELEQLFLDRTGWESYGVHKLDVTNNPKLRMLFAQSNSLDSLDVTKCPLLSNLYITHNNIKKLDMSKQGTMKELYIEYNKFNFTTMPKEVDEVNEYDYGMMQPLEVKQEVPVDSVLDFTSQVVISQAPTVYRVYKIDEKNLGNQTDLVEGTDYERDGAKIKFLKTQTDSVVCQFTNTNYPELALRTNPFLIKNPSDIGQYEERLAMTTDKPVGTYVSLGIACNKAATLHVDLGDGKIKEYGVDTYVSPWGGGINDTICGSNIKVYAPSDVQITSLSITDAGLTSIDLSKSSQLYTLTLNNNDLKTLDLKNLKGLMTMYVQNNKLESLDLSGYTDYYYAKAQLSYVDVSNNNISSFYSGNCPSLQFLILDNNKLKELTNINALKMNTIQANNNKLETVEVGTCKHLNYLMLNNNNLSALDLSYNGELQMLSVSDNYFDFNTLPAVPSTCYTYIYSPQKPIQISPNGRTVDLSSLYSVHDTLTTYYWMRKDASGTAIQLDEGTDYTIKNGVTTFLTTPTDSVYCDMTNAVWPNFTVDNYGSSISDYSALKTSCMLVSDDPTDSIATLYPNITKNTDVNLTLGAKKDGTFVYVDFGDGVMKACKLKTVYTNFYGTMQPNKPLKVYSYNKANNGVTIFSFSGAKLKSAKINDLKDVNCLGFTDSKLDTLDLSNNNKVTELLLAGNNFKYVDLASVPEVWFLNLGTCKLKAIDLTKTPKLKELHLEFNSFKTLTMPELDKLETLYCNSTGITSLDVSKCPALQWVSAEYNNLTTLDVSNNPLLHGMELNNNRFLFSTLPVQTDKITYYEYGDQQPVKVTAEGSSVNLSTEATVQGMPTTYSWFNEDGTQLTEGTDYTVSDGITTFLKSTSGNVYCTMTNDLYPKLTLTTEQLSIVVSGINALNGSDVSVKATKAGVLINAAMGNEVKIFTLNGAEVKSFRMEGNTVLVSDLIRNTGYVVKVVSNGKTVTKKVMF